MKNIVICDDDKDIVNAIKIYLENDDYNLFTAYNGQEAVDIVAKNDIHLVIMDIMMPVMDGIEAMGKIRELANTPIILLTAKGEELDKAYGLNTGADDYVTKPFNPIELIARVRAQLRRYITLGSANISKNYLKIGDVELDDDSKEVKVLGELRKLTPIEYEILKLLMSSVGRVFSVKEILAKVWNDVNYIDERTVTVHIRHLREKIELNPAEPQYLKVVWGHGYKFEGIKED